MAMIRLLIADDHELFREGLRALISATEDIELVGEAATGEQVIAQAEELRPDVVLMDINMPDMDGILATRNILQVTPETGIIMVTMLRDDSSVFSAMRAGARGYVLKGSKYRELLQTIRAVSSGQALFGPSIAARIMNFFDLREAEIEPSSPEEAFPELTPRELEVLELIAQGANNNDIAEKLVISIKTVRNHINSIFGKLQVADRSAAIIQARDAGFGRSDHAR
jgi:DNA-binding NarL/FixJ family response regulator